VVVVVVLFVMLTADSTMLYETFKVQVRTRGSHVVTPQNPTYFPNLAGGHGSGKTVAAITIMARTIRQEYFSFVAAGSSRRKSNDRRLARRLGSQ
jgi:hypothetical protein